MSGLNLDLAHFRGRVLQDALTDALAETWERRANIFDWAAPRPDDFNGRATAAELARRGDRCRQAAAACRQHAALIREGRSEPISSEVWDALEAAA